MSIVGNTSAVCARRADPPPPARTCHATVRAGYSQINCDNILAGCEENGSCLCLQGEACCALNGKSKGMGMVEKGAVSFQAVVDCYSWEHPKVVDGAIQMKPDVPAKR